jgi:3-phenylpropionate/trans-cinnamate dioxygenase ferredoxin reductase subunit
MKDHEGKQAMDHFIVIGAGQAGSSLVAKLRADGFEGKITLIGAEPEPPYQRPPLSKGYLLGEITKERLYLRPESFYADQTIDLRLSARVVGVDADARVVTLECGETLEYDKLALTTGSHPNTLPAAIGGSLDGVLTVRDLRDADAMAGVFKPGKSALIIGGGYIGLEAAAVAAKLGLKVTLVEMADRILQRVACPETSDFFRALHTAHGVEIKEGVGLERLIGNDRVSGAKLTDGSEIEIDFAIVGVGITPATALAEAAGVEVDAGGGIVTNAQARTTNAHIFAAGDCATCDFKGQRLRIESVGNAIDQAEVAAQAMMGKDARYDPKPWFWSDQFDCKLQIAGLNIGYTDVYVRKVEDAQSHWYYAGDQLIAVDSMNDTRGYMVGKRLIEAGKSPSPAAIMDPDTDLKALLKA